MRTYFRFLGVVWSESETPSSSDAERCPDDCLGDPSAVMSPSFEACTPAMAGLILKCFPCLCCEGVPPTSFSLSLFLLEVVVTFSCGGRGGFPLSAIAGP